MEFDFEQFGDNLRDYFSQNFGTYIEAINATKTDTTVPLPSKYIIDLVDPIKNTEQVVFYLIPWDYSFTALSNESESMQCRLKIVTTLNRENSEVLRKWGHRILNAIYKMIDKDRSLGNTVNDCIIENINYDPELTQSMKASVVDLILTKEIY